MNWVMNWILFAFFLPLIILLIVKFKKEEESYFALKTVGYFFLGAFRFTFNRIHFPLGFILYLTFFKNLPKNKLAKRYAACLGLIFFGLSLLIPAASDYYFERTRFVETVTTNIYSFNFQEHWKQVCEALTLDENIEASARLQNFRGSYRKPGLIESLTYQVIWMKNEQMYMVDVTYYEFNKAIHIEPGKMEQWPQYERLINAKVIFEKLDGIGIKKLTPEGEFEKYIIDYRGWGSIAIKDQDVCIVEDEITKVNQENLPVDGIWFVMFGNVENSDGSFRSNKIVNYIFR